MQAFLLGSTGSDLHLSVGLGKEILSENFMRFLDEIFSLCLGTLVGYFEEEVVNFILR